MGQSGVLFDTVRAEPGLSAGVDVYDHGRLGYELLRPVDARAGGPLSAPEGQACQNPTMCRSGVCANTQQGAFCQRDCTRDNHCGNAQSCMAMALDQNGTIARLCANAQGLAQNGSACAPGNHSCRSGICDNTTNQCQPLCCSAADCAPGLACNPTIIDQRGPVIVKVSRSGAGRRPAAGRGSLSSGRRLPVVELPR